ncbi:Peptidase S8, subtilisin-related like protein [Aduncisulcus paluster]|uniref:Peptidase S8, subtilisin-related like protein n=1 Tax=Aduncisulcus paluster TaxID=2918883 RepID=A0ABQ5K2Y2_9EUKA|nr:Peptidase S8, subtilisin-related like protein [Aduncisulcus paluster]
MKLVPTPLSYHYRFSDPLYPRQWHLHPVEDYETNHVSTYTNISWEETNGYGNGVKVVIVDDGLHCDHPDLIMNYYPALSRNYIDIPTSNINKDNPTPMGRTSHGTSCAGLVASRGNTGICGVGVAPEASISGRRAIAPGTTVGNIANSLKDSCNEVDIFSNSWGSSTCSGSLCESQITFPQWSNAVDMCLRNGRGGKGSIYVFASGNERKFGGDSNLYSSLFPYAPHVAAVSIQGIVAPYSNPGSAVFIAAPSNGYTSDGKVVALTTTSGASGCTNSFGGTSGATPIVAGSMALLLEQNPSLDYREVLYVLQSSAQVIDPYFSDETSEKHVKRERLLANLGTPSEMDIPISDDHPPISKQYLLGVDDQGYFWRLRPNGAYHNRNYGYGLLHVPSLTRLSGLVRHGRIPSLDPHTMYYKTDPNVLHAALTPGIDISKPISWNTNLGVLAIPFSLRVSGSPSANSRFIAEYIKVGVNVSGVMDGIDQLLASLIIPSSLSTSSSPLNPILGDHIMPIGRKDPSTYLTADSFSLSASIFGTPLHFYSLSDVLSESDDEVFYLTFSSPLASSLSFDLSSASVSVFGYFQAGCFDIPFAKLFKMKDDDTDMRKVDELSGGVLKIGSDVSGSGSIDLEPFVNKKDFLSHFDQENCVDLSNDDPQLFYVCSNLISERVWRVVAVPISLEKENEEENGGNNSGSVIYGNNFNYNGSFSTGSNYRRSIFSSTTKSAGEYVIVSSSFSMDFGHLPNLYGTKFVEVKDNNSYITENEDNDPQRGGEQGEEENPGNNAANGDNIGDIHGIESMSDSSFEKVEDDVSSQILEEEESDNTQEKDSSSKSGITSGELFALLFAGLCLVFVIILIITYCKRKKRLKKDTPPDLRTYGSNEILYGYKRYGEEAEEVDSQCGIGYTMLDAQPPDLLV